jgi:hypothetical protein
MSGHPSTTPMPLAAVTATHAVRVFDLGPGGWRPRRTAVGVRFP